MNIQHRGNFCRRKGRFENGTLSDPFLKAAFVDTGMTVNPNNVKRLCFQELIQPAPLHAEDSPGVTGRKSVGVFLPRCGAVNLLVMELGCVPFLKAVQHDPHFLSDDNDFKVSLFYQPVSGSLFQTEHPL